MYEQKGQCPCCSSTYSGPRELSHDERCPWPLTLQYDDLRERLLRYTYRCPECGGDVYENRKLEWECALCSTRYIAVAGATPAPVDHFYVEGVSVPVAPCMQKGSSDFPGLAEVQRLEREVAARNKCFKK